MRSHLAFVALILLTAVGLAPPTHDEAAFLSGIKAEPKDNTLRLVYADWLDEHGEPERAEFIRLQVKLSTLTSSSSDYGLLKTRERALRNDPKAAGVPSWFYTTLARSPIPGAMPLVATSEERALLEAIQQKPGDLGRRREYADWLHAHGRPAQASLIRIATDLYQSEPTDAAYKPLLNHFQMLLAQNRDAGVKAVPAFSIKIPERGIVPSFTRGFISGVRCVESRFVDRGAEILRLAPALEQLEIYALPASHSTSSTDAFRVIAREKPSNLTHLVLTGMSISADDIALIETVLPKLAHLDLRDARIDAPAFLRLVRGPLGRNLASLRVHATFFQENAPHTAISHATVEWATHNTQLVELTPTLRALLPVELHGRIRSADQIVCESVLAAFLSPN